MSTLVDDSVNALSERLADLGHTVQSRMTTPVTEESTTHVEMAVSAAVRCAQGD